MSNGRIYLLALLVWAATGAAFAIQEKRSVGEFAVAMMVNLVALTPMLLLGGAVLGVKGSRPALVATTLSGWIGGTTALALASQGVIPGVELGGFYWMTGLLAIWVMAMLAGGLGLLVGSHIEPKPPPSHLCLKCGYDRRGLASDAKCPECGA
ncbi:MAG TPA: hypothetical protein VD997_06365 [Phycisphaerales bacterium]|nr:hypothetical protein [Phycisphaerales bacterium]